MLSRKELAEAGRRKLEEFRKAKVQGKVATTAVRITTDDAPRTATVSTSLEPVSQPIEANGTAASVPTSTAHLNTQPSFATRIPDPNANPSPQQSQSPHIPAAPTALEPSGDRAPITTFVVLADAPIPFSAPETVPAPIGRISSNGSSFPWIPPTNGTTTTASTTAATPAIAGASSNSTAWNGSSTWPEPAAASPSGSLGNSLPLGPTWRQESPSSQTALRGDLAFFGGTATGPADGGFGAVPPLPTRQPTSSASPAGGTEPSVALLSDAGNRHLAERETAPGASYEARPAPGTTDPTTIGTAVTLAPGLGASHSGDRSATQMNLPVAAPAPSDSGTLAPVDLHTGGLHMGGTGSLSGSDRMGAAFGTVPAPSQPAATAPAASSYSLFDWRSPSPTAPLAPAPLPDAGTSATAGEVPAGIRTDAAGTSGVIDTSSSGRPDWLSYSAAAPLPPAAALITAPQPDPHSPSPQPPATHGPSTTTAHYINGSDTQAGRLPPTQLYDSAAVQRSPAPWPMPPSTDSVGAKKAATTAAATESIPSIGPIAAAAGVPAPAPAIATGYEMLSDSYLAGPSSRAAAQPLAPTTGSALGELAASQPPVDVQAGTSAAPTATGRWAEEASPQPILASSGGDLGEAAGPGGHHTGQVSSPLLPTSFGSVSSPRGPGTAGAVVPPAPFSPVLALPALAPPPPDPQPPAQLSSPSQGRSVTSRFAWLFGSPPPPSKQPQPPPLESKPLPPVPSLLPSQPATHAPTPNRPLPPPPSSIPHPLSLHTMTTSTTTTHLTQPSSQLPLQSGPITPDTSHTPNSQQPPQSDPQAAIPAPSSSHPTGPFEGPAAGLAAPSQDPPSSSRPSTAATTSSSRAGVPGPGSGSAGLAETGWNRTSANGNSVEGASNLHGLGQRPQGQDAMGGGYGLGMGHGKAAAGGQPLGTDPYGRQNGANAGVGASMGIGMGVGVPEIYGYAWPGADGASSVRHGGAAQAAFSTLEYPQQPAIGPASTAGLGWAGDASTSADGPSLRPPSSLAGSSLTDGPGALTERSTIPTTAIEREQDADVTSTSPAFDLHALPSFGTSYPLSSASAPPPRPPLAPAPAAAAASNTPLPNFNTAATYLSAYSAAGAPAAAYSSDTTTNFLESYLDNLLSNMSTSNNGTKAQPHPATESALSPGTTAVGMANGGPPDGAVGISAAGSPRVSHPGEMSAPGREQAEREGAEGGEVLAEALGGSHRGSDAQHAGEGGAAQRGGQQQHHSGRASIDSAAGYSLLSSTCTTGFAQGLVSSHGGGAGGRASQFSALQQHIDELTEEKLSLMRGLQQQLRINEQLAEENEDLTRRYNARGAAVEELERKLKQYEQELEAQALTLEGFSDERQAARSGYAEAASRAQALASEVVGLEAQVLQLKSAVLKAERAAEEAKQQTRKLEKQVESLTKEAAARSQELQQVQLKGRNLVVKLKQTEAKLEAAEEKLALQAVALNGGHAAHGAARLTNGFSSVAPLAASSKDTAELEVQCDLAAELAAEREAQEREEAQVQAAAAAAAESEEDGRHARPAASVSPSEMLDAEPSNQLALAVSTAMTGVDESAVGTAPDSIDLQLQLVAWEAARPQRDAASATVADRALASLEEADALRRGVALPSGLADTALQLARWLPAGPISGGDPVAVMVEEELRLVQSIHELIAAQEVAQEETSCRMRELQSQLTSVTRENDELRQKLELQTQRLELQLQGMSTGLAVSLHQTPTGPSERAVASGTPAHSSGGMMQGPRAADLLATPTRSRMMAPLDSSTLDNGPGSAGRQSWMGYLFRSRQKKRVRTAIL